MEKTTDNIIKTGTRWWNSVRKQKRGGKTNTTTRDVDDYEEEETEQKIETPTRTTKSFLSDVVSENNALSATIDEDDIREHFSKRFLIPKSRDGTEGKTRDGSDPLSLYRHYSRMQQQQMEDELGYEDGENDETDSPVVVVPPESQYFGRTSKETERIRREIRDKILNEHKDLNAEKADDLLSRHQNLGAVRTESFYERKLVKKESERGLNAYDAGRRVST